jgi:hypothetical protein
MTDLKEKRDLLAATSKNLSKALRCELSNIVLSFGRHFDEDYYAGVRSREILADTTEFSSPLSMIGAVNNATLDIKSLFQDRDKINSPVEMKNKGAKYLAEEGVFDVVVRHSILLSRLISIRTEKEREDVTSEPWDAKEATKRLRFILDRLTSALDLNIFSSENATNIYNETAATGEAITVLRKRLETELPQRARLHMSTIGSFTEDKNEKDGSDHSGRDDYENDSDDVNDVAYIFVRLTLNGSDSKFSKDTICIFDESGCIPAYEILGLSRLGRTINALVLVGDKHQLPPYDPMQGRKSGPTRNEQRGSKKILSLLDSSALTIGAGKVMLTTQYRVPRDIAEMLNARVYKGQYKTCLTAKVPDSGLSSLQRFAGLIFHSPYQSYPCP